MSFSGRVGIKGLNKFDEYVVSFEKGEDNTYTKITKKVTRDRTTSVATYYKRDNPIIEEGPYRLTNETDNYDEKMEYEDFDGGKRILYFKKMIDES
jgi:hypothetical protein